MGSESSSLSSGSSSEEESSSQTESGDSSEESSESSSQAEKTDKITITQSGEYAGIDPMKQVVIRTGEVTIPGYDHHRRPVHHGRSHRRCDAGECHH